MVLNSWFFMGYKVMQPRKLFLDIDRNPEEHGVISIYSLKLEDDARYGSEATFYSFFDGKFVHFYRYARAFGPATFQEIPITEVQKDQGIIDRILGDEAMGYADRMINTYRDMGIHLQFERREMNTSHEL